MSMTEREAINHRHSVRQYTNKPLEAEIISELQAEVDACNLESGLHIQLITNEPKAFDGFMAHYGKFRGVTNYFALIGKKSANLNEKCGYYGEKLCIVIALGYGETQGIPHKSKPASSVMQTEGTIPTWFENGIEAALLAPTAINQQKFLFTLKGNRVSAKAKMGAHTDIDLGIVKYHFEIGAGKNNFKWESCNHSIIAFSQQEKSQYVRLTTFVSFWFLYILSALASILSLIVKQKAYSFSNKSLYRSSSKSSNTILS